MKSHTIYRPDFKEKLALRDPQDCWGDAPMFAVRERETENGSVLNSRFLILEFRTAILGVD